jgi:hypothetical protein
MDFYSNSDASHIAIIDEKNSTFLDIRFLNKVAQIKIGTNPLNWHEIISDLKKIKHKTWCNKIAHKQGAGMVNMILQAKLFNWHISI